MADVPFTYGHRSRSSETVLKLAMKPGEIGFDSSSRSFWFLDYDDNHILVNPVATASSFKKGSNTWAQAIQAAIDSALRLVFLPAGTLEIDSPLTIANKDGFRLVGENKCGTVLEWTGAAGGTLMTMRGSRFSAIQHLRISGGDLADTCLEMPSYLSGTDTYSCLGNTLDHLRIDDVRNGTAGVCLRIGDTVGTQIDNLTINNCYIANSPRLVTIQGNVVFHIKFNDCIFSGYHIKPTTVGVDVSDRSGLIYFEKCQFVGSSPTIGYVRRSPNSGLISFSRCEQEGNGPFLVGYDDSGFANIWSVDLVGCTIGHTDLARSFTCTLQSNTTVLTSNTEPFYVGKFVTGSGIPANTYITSVDHGVGFTISNAATASGSAIVSIERDVVKAGIANGAHTFTMAPITFSNVTTNTSSLEVTMSSTAGAVPGRMLSGTGVAAGTYVVSIRHNAGITLSELPTANGVITLTQLAEERFAIGQAVSGTGIPGSTTIAYRNAGYVDLSANATASASGVALTIGGSAFTGHTLSGSSRVYLTAVGGIAGGQAITGSGIPGGTTVSSVTTEVSYAMSAAATATNANAALTIPEMPIDYRQRGAVLIYGGRINASTPRHINFAAPGTAGSTGGLVQDIGVNFPNISVLTSGASQRYSTTLTGDVSWGGKFTLNGSTGNVGIAGYTAIGGALDVTGNLSAADMEARSATVGQVSIKRTAAAAAADEVASVDFHSANASGYDKVFARIRALVDDATNGSEDSSLRVKLLRAGSEITALTMDSSGYTKFTGLHAGTLDIGGINVSGAGSEPGVLMATSKNSSSNQTVWGKIRFYVTDATAGSEDASLYLSTMAAGNVYDSGILSYDGLALAGANLQLSTQRTPASATATGTKGQICHDADYIYVCTATNTWKRAAITW